MDAAGDNRAMTDGVPEVAVIYQVGGAGTAKVFNIHGRELFSTPLISLRPAAIPPIGKGGPPTIADFDGDGRVEFASAGATAYHVFDPDCRGTPDAASCPSMRTDGIAWAKESKDESSNVTGSTVFDFDGDGRAEVVYGDECFTRVYDGITGSVLYSRFRTSCTWYEMPVIADVDADFNAEIVSTSNANCNVVCPAVDPIFDGVQCTDDSDCPLAAPCERDAPGDALGRCRCTQDADCGGDGFVCLDPIAGPAPGGKVCRASHPATDLQGIRVLADGVDRWVNTRGIWNQHAYSVTNIEGNGRVPRTSALQDNWTQQGLNNFRQNAPGEGQTAGAIPDLTVKRAKASCDGPGSATITAEVCNRGTEPVAQGLPVAVYTDASPPVLACMTQTTERIFPAISTPVTCAWTAGSGDGYVSVDDRGDATGTNLECREDNNVLGFSVDCP